jgi:hypothetical protein
VEEFLDQSFDVVVTVCDSAAQDCPTWPGAKSIEHWSIEDPSYGPDDPATRFDRFLATRDELRGRIDELAASLREPEAPKSSKNEARRAWAGFGLEIPAGRGPIELDMGLTPKKPLAILPFPERE